MITIDQTTISENCVIMGMGIVNQKGEHHAIGLIASSASKGLEIGDDMIALIRNTGFYQKIMKIRYFLIIHLNQVEREKDLCRKSSFHHDV